MNDTTKEKEKKQNPEPDKTTDRKTTNQIPPRSRSGEPIKNPGQRNTNR